MISNFSAIASRPVVVLPPPSDNLEKALRAIDPPPGLKAAVDVSTHVLMNMHALLKGSIL